MIPSTLTRSQFSDACKALLTKYSDANGHNEHIMQILGNWSWTEHPHIPGIGYLARETTISAIQPLNQDEYDADLGDCAFQEDETSSDTVTVSSYPTLQVCQYVVFSPTFQVPAFYFSVHSSNGSPLTLDDILRTTLFRPHAFPSAQRTDFALQLPTANFPLLSQGDHPTLGTPCWYFHPCETSVAVGEIMQEDKFKGTEEEKQVRWLEIWFMILNGVVDLR